MINENLVYSRVIVVDLNEGLLCEISQAHRQVNLVLDSEALNGLTQLISYLRYQLRLVSVEAFTQTLS